MHNIVFAENQAADITEKISEENWSAHFQSTYIWQTKPSFPAAYSGENSLRAVHEKSYSFTATAFLGLRLWSDAELYLNPEIVQGVPLSNLTGLGGLTNGELQKTAGPHPLLYRARLFARQTVNLQGEQENIEAAANQLASRYSRNKLVFTVGNLSVTDIFDVSSAAHDARSQFLNWSLLTHGAYDYAADARGYSWGSALEYYQDNWVLRVGRFMLPKESNGLALDANLLRHYGDQIELAHTHALAGQSGQVRVLFFRNVAQLGRFDDALNQARISGNTPSMNGIRKLGSKLGAGVSLEQNINQDVAMFAKLAANDGQSEAYAFTEIDRSFSIGVQLKSSAWASWLKTARAQDKLGLALAINGLSAAHQRYLRAGGIGFFLGDGALRYKPETILELYYSAALHKNVWLTADAQAIRNPGYNAARGPAYAFALRLHTEF